SPTANGGASLGTCFFLSLIYISDPTRLRRTSHVVFHMQKKKLTLDCPHRGRVLAVVVPLPGSGVNLSLLLDENGQADYYDIPDCTLLEIL
ncbi:hypothetical protein, partial [Escherichia coli]|uniref:hypothetical protein n=1 Tax=Escherichia coli TaxID=562 RepID=UPI001BD5CACD